MACREEYEDLLNVMYSDENAEQLVIRVRWGRSHWPFLRRCHPPAPPAGPPLPMTCVALPPCRLMTLPDATGGVTPSTGNSEALRTLHEKYMRNLKLQGVANIRKAFIREVCGWP